VEVSVLMLQPSSAGSFCFIRMLSCMLLLCSAGLAAGPVLWVLINVAIAIKTGNTDTWLAAAGDAASSSSSSSPGVLLLGGGGGGAGVGWVQLPQLLLAAAASPAGEVLRCVGIAALQVLPLLGVAVAANISLCLCGMPVHVSQWLV
jgi:hypothetical protein